MPVDRREVRLRRGDLHEIMPNVVVGPCAPDPQVGASRPDQRLSGGQDQGLGRGSGRSGEVLGEALALVNVEESEAFQKEMASGSSPVSRARAFSSSGTKRSA